MFNDLVNLKFQRNFVFRWSIWSRAVVIILKLSHSVLLESVGSSQKLTLKRGNEIIFSWVFPIPKEVSGFRGKVPPQMDFLYFSCRNSNWQLYTKTVAAR